MFAASKTASASGGYQISRSLRFNSPDSAYLSRTPASATNRRTWTWSGWIKRSSLVKTNELVLFACRPSAYTIFSIRHSGTANPDTILLEDNNGTNLRTTQVFRDVSAWYHIVLAVDTTQATSTDRVKLYVNGSQVTAFSATTYPTQNVDLQINTANSHGVGGYSYSAAESYDGYMTEVNFIDGSQLTPSSFGETNAQTGVWSPIICRSAYGTNGFYLNFSDNSNTTAATLGKDYSGNGNNWTPNNFSVTAGAGNDSLVDSPTSYGTDTGVGGTVRGNYCTLNPLNAGSTATLSNGNLNITGTIAATTSLAYSTIGVSSGKWYWEVTPLTGDHMIGIGKDGGRFDWQTTNGYSYFGNNGQKYTNSAGSAYGATYANNDVIGVGLDMDAGTLTFYKNGTSQGTAFSGLTGTWFPIAQNPGSPLTEAFNFGQRPFAYTAPSGFKALCTQNLPTPTIGATTATQAGKFFNPVLYNGNGGTLSVTGVGFQPDWVWLKVRNYAFVNGLFDSVRGGGKLLISNLTLAEINNDPNGYVSSFNSDGFTLTPGTTNNDTFNGSLNQMVSWNWKAGGTAVTNNAGSVTSTVSANTTSGFSIVTWTGNGSSGQTVGHGLGVAPSFYFLKQRNGSTYGWIAYHSALGANKYLLLNTTNAGTTDTDMWNNTAPTSSVFSLSGSGGNAPITNPNTGTMVAYCFAPIAGYSAFGSYTGNGSADGPFVYCGFKPAYLLVKQTNGANYWFVFDSARDTSNVVDLLLDPNDSRAEISGALFFDFLSNGFKSRATDAGQNASGGTYIYMAFASAPFKFSLAR